MDADQWLLATMSNDELLDLGGKLLVGFKPAVYEASLG